MLKSLGSLALAAVIGVAAFAPAAQAAPSIGNASTWTSGAPVGPGLFPIGGAGQINGEFILDTVPVGGSLLEIGLRAQERFQGPTLLRVGSTFFSEPGESTPGAALWNYDIHLDFRAGGPPLNMRDFIVTFSIDTDPGAGQSFQAFNMNVLTAGLGPVVSLFQTSQNIGFGGLGDPNIPGIYDFLLEVSTAGAGVVASTSMTVVVVSEPAGLALTGLGLLTIGLMRRKRRK